MKKIFLFAAILFAGVSMVNAQAIESSTDEGETRLTVTLNPIQTITVTDDLVDLLYAEEIHYKDGVTSQKDNHLNVYSTGGFAVTVNSKDDFLTAVGGTANYIPANTISVEAPDASAQEGFTSNGVVKLSKAGSQLFSTTKGGIDLNYRVDYVGAGTEAYFDKLFNATSASVYETTVTYTIVAN